MSGSMLRRTAKVALPALACLTVATLASTASAARPDGGRNTYSGASAYVSWTELDPNNLLGLPGNTHVGWLDVQDGGPWGGSVYGSIVDFQCEKGQIPDPHGGPGACAFVQERNLQSEDGTLTVTGSTATFKGTIIVTNGGHGGDGNVLAEVPANVTWKTSARLTRFRAMNSYDDRGWGTSYRSSMSGLRSDEASTVVGGALGRMGFADDADDVSSGAFRTFTETSRERIRQR